MALWCEIKGWVPGDSGVFVWFCLSLYTVHSALYTLHSTLYTCNSIDNFNSAGLVLFPCVLFHFLLFVIRDRSLKLKGAEIAWGN